MTAATQNSKPTTLGAHALVDRLNPMGVKSATHIYLGTMIALTLAGYLAPASADPSVRVVGYAEAEADNSAGAAGDLTLIPCRGAILLQNSATTDALTDADVGRRCYVVDDRTVARTSSNGLRPVAGRVVAVTTAGVFVEVGVGTEPEGAIDLYIAAGADLSTTGQYLAVVLGSGGTVTVCGTAGADCLGICQNAPASGAIAIVRVAGVSKWMASATINPGVRLASDNAGKSKAANKGITDSSGASATAALVGSFVMGLAQTAGASSALHQVLVQPMGAIPTTMT